MKITEASLRRLIKEAIDEQNRKSLFKQQLKKYSAIVLASAAAYFLGKANMPMVTGDHQAAKEEVFLEVLETIGKEEVLDFCKDLEHVNNPDFQQVCASTKDFLQNHDF